VSVGVVILCAGLGTRLRPLTNEVPKPALPVLDAPLIRLHLRLAREIGADDIAINTHHLADEMRACARREARFLGMAIRVSHEPTIQGTGGGVRQAMAGRGHDLIVVLNGDTVFDVDLVGALRAHRRSGAAATMVLAPMPKRQNYAAVEADKVMRVRRIAGVGLPQAKLQPWHFTGVHLIGPAFFEYAPTGPSDINRDVYPDMIDRGLVVAGHIDLGYWSDVGTPERLLALHLDFLGGRVPRRCGEITPGVDPSAVVDPDARVRGRVYVGPAARIAAGAMVGPDAFIGSGVRIGKGAKVRRSVVLAGTRIAEKQRLEDSVVLGERRVSIRRSGSGRART
jgi:mannose-1-phosphate guanylyltransferase